MVQEKGVFGLMEKASQADKKSYKIQQSVAGQNKSKLQRYQELVIGSSSLSALIKYELIVLFSSWIPGALGIFLRSKLYPSILGKAGKGVIFGSNVVLRHPKKIFLGDNIIIDDNVMRFTADVKAAGFPGGSVVFNCITAECIAVSAILLCLLTEKYSM